MRGDIFGPAGYVDEGADTYTIQGLALESETHGLEYRVRFPDGAWSDWVGEGVFAGTRGQSLPITGFAARLTEPLRQQFEVQTRGLFVGGVAVDAQRRRGLRRPLRRAAARAPGDDPPRRRAAGRSAGRRDADA